MFGCTRIPEVGQDRMYRAEGAIPNHIVVIAHGNFYKVDFGGDRVNISLSGVRGVLKEILADKGGYGIPIGALTCDNRDSWATNRKRLLEIDPKNAVSLKAIDDALFVLCLDDSEDDSLEGAMRTAVHGNPRHRWFDKPCTLIITKHGKLCMNSEHSWGDGIAMMRWGSELAKEVRNPTYDCEEGVGPDYRKSTIIFELDKELEGAVEAAGMRADALGNSTRQTVVHSDAFGAEFLKAHKLSPDAAVQQVLQLAYMKRHGVSVSQYCVAQHMAFKAGRNERVHSNTGLSAEFVKAAVEGAKSAKEQFGLLKAACDRHSALSRQCVMGKGFDRHLYALNAIAEEAAKVKVDSAALMQKAMSNPVIMEVMMNPKARVIAGKIKADPTVLANPMKAFGVDLAADPELSAMFVKIAPILEDLKPKAKPVPGFFKDPAFLKLMKDKLCSSNIGGQLTAASCASPAFGDYDDAGKEEGGDTGNYYIHYGIFGDNIDFFVNGFKPSDMDAFGDAIRESADLVKMIIKKAHGEVEVQPNVDVQMETKPEPELEAKGDVVTQFSVGDSVKSAWGTGTVSDVREDGTVCYVLDNWDLAYGSKVKCYLNPASVEKRKSVEFVAGDSVKSAWGTATVSEVRDDGTVVCILDNWDLAYGSKVKCYLNPTSVEKE